MLTDNLVLILFTHRNQVQLGVNELKQLQQQQLDNKENPISAMTSRSSNEIGDAVIHITNTLY